MSYKEYLYNPSGGEGALFLKNRKVESPGVLILVEVNGTAEETKPKDVLEVHV
jgi:hypothetical protein